MHGPGKRWQSIAATDVTSPTLLPWLLLPWLTFVRVSNTPAGVVSWHIPCRRAVCVAAVQPTCSCSRYCAAHLFCLNRQCGLAEALLAATEATRKLFQLKQPFPVVKRW